MSNSSSPSNRPDSHREAHEHTPERDEVADTEQEARSLHEMKRVWAVLATALVLAFVMINSSTGGASGLVQRLTGGGDTTVTGEKLSPTPPNQDGPPTLTDFDHHPDYLYESYLTGPVIGEGSENGSGSKGNGSQKANLNQEFRELLQIYQWRMAEDDNFTIRVIDDRTNEVLEVFELEEKREQHEENGNVDISPGGAIDQKRRTITNRLVDKYVNKGIPQEAIMVKWGRGNQVRQAQELNNSYIEYAVRLSKYLDMSLLVTQIGLVETFNHDRWKSSVGARSRYQMMPSFLVQLKINRYNLKTKNGGSIKVREEWNPLMTMEPAFKIAAGYRGAVGHEIPGISAYHTGPGNIYKVYRYFLKQNPQRVGENTDVMDAYMWATTTGYQYMSAHSSFGPFSRGYVTSAYGALKALDSVPIDTSKTLLATRVRMKKGASASLREILNALKGKSYPKLPEKLVSTERASSGSDPPPTVINKPDDALSLYQKFQKLNPQIVLPAAADSASGVPEGGNVVLTRTAQGDQVHFFLPLGGAKKLQEAGLDVLDESETFRFDHSTYANPKGTEADAYQEYQDLIDRIFHYGFTRENKQDLNRLARETSRLAEENPTPWRKDMAEVVQSHRKIWAYGVWNDLRQATRQAFGTVPPDARASTSSSSDDGGSTPSTMASAR
jgi:hypothetical protein